MNVSPIYILGGEAVFTVERPEGLLPRWYTYKVRKASDCDDKRTRYFAGLLTEPDNNRGYKYIGMVDALTGRLVITRGSKLPAESAPVVILEQALMIVFGRRELPEGYRILHTMKCSVCGLKLTTPLSIDRGIGPKCWDDLGKKK